MSDLRCKHVRSGKRSSFMTAKVGGTLPEGEEMETTVDVCIRCFGGALWLLLEKLPDETEVRFQREGNSLKMCWAAEEQAP